MSLPILLKFFRIEQNRAILLACIHLPCDGLMPIAIDCPQDELVLEIPQPEENTVVTMLGCEKVLPWKYEDGKMIIDTTPLKYNDLKSDAAWTFKISR